MGRLKTSVVISIIGLCTIINYPSHVSALNDDMDLILTESEEKALEELKELLMVHEVQLPEEFMTNFYLIRWLRGFYDAKGAQIALTKSMQWREENNISDILNEDWDDMTKTYPVTFGGYDKENRPLILLDVGKWAIKTGIQDGQYDKLLRYINWIFETNLQEILNIRQKEGNENVTRSVILIDSEGSSWRQHFCSSCVSLLSKWLQTFESNYPAFFDEIIVINSPSFTTYASKLIRPFLSADTKRCMKTFSYKDKQWLQYFDEHISKDQRTANYGGIKDIGYALPVFSTVDRLGVPHYIIHVPAIFV